MGKWDADGGTEHRHSLKNAEKNIKTVHPT